MSILAIALLGFISLISGVTVHKSPENKRIDNKYIIKFKPYATEESIVKYFQYATHSNITTKPFKIGDFKGVFAELSPSQFLDHVSMDDILEYIEEDRIVSLQQATCTAQKNPTWGLERICERTLDLTTEEYRYPSTAGRGVNSYIIDTGIRVTHKDFGGRAYWGANFADDGDNTDSNGHGTHVAGTVGSNTYGVAKHVRLFAVKVLDRFGSGTLSGVISGIQWVVENAIFPANANMSLGGSYSTAINEAVKNGVAAGITFVLAAGNEASDACNSSPASESTAITVGATEQGSEDTGNKDVMSYFSNWGPCVHVFAPGSMIESTWHTSDTATNTISGTSMASPHVCGVVSNIQGAYLPKHYTPAEIKNLLVESATSDVIDISCGSSDDCQRTPNLMAYTNCVINQ